MILFYRLFRQNPDTREGVITTTSGIGILVNLLIALVKIVIGAIASSVAIMSEGMNNATDAFSSVMTLVGTKLSGKHPDEKHPFGYGRIEYLSSLVISGIILFTGIEMLLSSVELIFSPAEMSISFLSVGIVAVTAVLKFFLGVYTIQKGKETDSGALTAVGTEGRNDSFASVITVLASLVFLFTGVSLDAYAGIVISILIIKAGFESLRDTVGDILGRAGDHALAEKIYGEIAKTPGVLAAADIMLHNYGPDRWSGSVNVEIDHAKTVGEVYQVLHELQMRIMHEDHVVMVFGVYAVDNDHEESRALRQEIGTFVLTEEHIKSFHAVYADEAAKVLYCDFIVDYALSDWDAVRSRFRDYMKEKYPDYRVELTVETEYA